MNKTISYFVLVLSVFVSLNSHALGDRAFDSLIDFAAKTGKRQASQFGVFKTLGHVQNFGNETGYKVNYFSFVGGEGIDGNFNVGRVEMVSEFWGIDENGNWDIDQWLYKVSLDGKPTWVAHYRLVQTFQGVVLLHQGIDSTPEHEIAEFKKMLSFWLSQISE